MINQTEEDMDARTYYLSRLRPSASRHGSSLEKEEQIRNIMTEWVLFRQYWQESDSATALAEKIDVSGEELASFISDCFGERFTVIRKRLRIDDACHIMLRYPDMPVSQAGRTVGIFDKSDFRKIFVKEKGCTPSVWKKCGGRKDRILVSLLLDKARNRFQSPRKS